MSTTCPECSGPTVIRSVPTGVRGLLADDPETVRVCEVCLLAQPAPGAALTPGWDPAAVNGALPTDPDAAIALSFLVTFLSSLALHRAEIEETVVYLEEAHGVDPLLALDRLKTTPQLQPAIDLSRRREQLAQLLSR